MTKFIVSTLALLAVASPVLAETSAPVQFTRDGETYKYVVVTQKSGVRYIQGTVLSTGEDFTLRVSGNSVDGAFGSRQVNFLTTDIATADRLASR